jgi:hypothetical protein
MGEIDMKIYVIVCVLFCGTQLLADGEKGSFSFKMLGTTENTSKRGVKLVIRNEEGEYSEVEDKKAFYRIEGNAVQRFDPSSRGASFVALATSVTLAGFSGYFGGMATANASSRNSNSSYGHVSAGFGLSSILTFLGSYFAADELMQKNYGWFFGADVIAAIVGFLCGGLSK